jgi:hypothetical protein
MPRTRMELFRVRASFYRARGLSITDREQNMVPKDSKVGTGLQLQQSTGPAGQAGEGYQSIRIESQKRRFLQL